MAFNLGAGLSAMGKSVAQSGALYILEQQRSALDMQRVQLAASLSAQERQAERGQRLEDERGLINMRHDLEAGDYSPSTKTDTENRIILTNKKGETMVGPAVAPDRTASEPLEPVYDEKTGKTTYATRSEARGKAVPPKAGGDEPLEAVYDPETGTETYVRRSQAAGKQKRPPRDGAGSPAAVVAPIFAQIAEKGEESLTPGQRAALARYEKLSLAQIIGRTITSGPEFGGIGGATPTPAVEEDDPGLPISQRRAATPTPPAKKETAKIPDGKSPAQVLTEAKAAIGKGADRQKVIERLKSWGVDTTGL